MLLHKSVEFDSRVRREAATLAEAGHQVTVLELARVPAGVSTLDGFARRSVLPSLLVRRLLPFHAYRVAFLLRFIREIVRLRSDVVHAHDAAMLLPGVIGARLTGAKLVYDSHELAASVPYRERAWSWFVSTIERLVVPRCDAVVTVSDGIARRLQESYRLSRRPAVVRNVSALAADGRSGLRARLGLDTDASVVLHQGAPAPARGCELLVRAVARLKHVTLVFLGDPEPGYGTILRAEIARLGISARVFMLPSVPLRDLLAHTAEADVGVTLLEDTCENHRLALPNKLFEYVATEVPVVASDLPECRRLVEDHGIGWTVAPGDEEALADALRAALSRSSSSAVRAKLAEAARTLTWPSERERLIAVYDAL